jgi:hypothetical protein
LLFFFCADYLNLCIFLFFFWKFWVLFVCASGEKCVPTLCFKDFVCWYNVRYGDPLADFFGFFSKSQRKWKNDKKKGGPVSGFFSSKDLLFFFSEIFQRIYCCFFPEIFQRNYCYFFPEKFENISLKMFYQNGKSITLSLFIC